MTRTALSPRLSAHLPEPFLDLHPNDAQKLGLSASDLVRVQSPVGVAVLRARITDAVQPGQVFAPIHWTGETAPSARIDAVVPAYTDPVSGQPESKAASVAVTRFDAAWYGFAVSRKALDLQSDYWALARTPQGYRAELAGRTPLTDWEREARRLFNAPDATLSSVIDDTRGTARIALHEGDSLLGALFISPKPVAVMRDYLQSLPGAEAPFVLTGRSPADMPNPGPILCSCFGIGINTIVEAIETKGLISVEAIGDTLSAGTNCGSCRAELAELLQSVTVKEAAE